MTEESTLPSNDVVVSTTEPEQTVDLAPTEEPESAEDKTRKAINKKHWQMEEARRETAAVRAELDALKAEQHTPVTAPIVPDMPDYLALTEDEFRAQMVERDTALTKKAEYDAGLNYQTQQTARQNEDAQREQQAESDKFRASYADRATELGLDADEVLAATGDIYNYGVSDAVAGMLTDPKGDGPLLAMYLRQNPLELQAMQSMPLHAQVEHMNSVIRTGAASLQKKHSSAPPPPTRVTGGGSINKIDPLLEGVTISVY